MKSAIHHNGVIMPDCHRGETAEGKEDMMAWITSMPWDTIISNDFARLMTWLSENGAKSIGAIGFCWGVWALCKASSVGVPLKCGVGNHAAVYTCRSHANRRTC